MTPYTGDITPDAEFIWQVPGSSVSKRVRVEALVGESPRMIHYRDVGASPEADWLKMADEAQFRAHVTAAEKEAA